jgi:hypothetical protein
MNSGLLTSMEVYSNYCVVRNSKKQYMWAQDGIFCYVVHYVDWGNPSVDGRIILRWIFRKWDVGVWA